MRTRSARWREVVPSRSGYHNKEWAGMMRAIGLIPSDTSLPGGKEVWQRVSHHIEAGGRFEHACAELVEKGFDPLYIERWSEGGVAKDIQFGHFLVGEWVWAGASHDNLTEPIHSVGS